MKIVDAAQIPFAATTVTPFDAVIAASGFEGRAVHVARQLKPKRGQRRIALAFTERQVHAREENDRILRQLGYILVPCGGDDTSPVRDLMADLVRDRKRKTLSILIDYSCMTRSWYATMLEAIRVCRSGLLERVDVHFTYSAPRFTPAPPRALNQYMEPIRGFGGLSDPSERTALILGLGYEPERAQGLVDLLEPAESYAFYTDPSFDRRFTRDLIESNKVLLKSRLRKDAVCTYPANSLQIASCRLTPLCLHLSRERYRVIIAPLGSKPFCLLSLLIASKFPELEVWRVSAADRHPPVNKKALGPVVVCKATFTNG